MRFTESVVSLFVFRKVAPDLLLRTNQRTNKSRI